MKAHRGKWYEADIDVPWYERAMCNESVVLGKLGDAGFDQVVVRKTGTGKYHARAFWPHPDSDDVDLPSEVVKDSIVES